MRSIARDDRRGRRGAAGHDLDRVVELQLGAVGRVGEHVEHDRRAAEMGDAVLARSARKIAAGSTRRRQTCVPATAVTAQVKHQPLQWNIGSVQR